MQTLPVGASQPSCPVDGSQRLGDMPLSLGSHILFGCCRQDKNSVSSPPLEPYFDIPNDSIKHLLNSLLLRPEKLAKTSSNQLLLPNPTIKLLSISLGYYCIKTELICTISMIYILPLYPFWKARSRTCQIIVYTPLLVSLSKLGNVLYTIGKVFWCSSSAMEIMWIGPWEAEIFKEQVWRRSLEEINLGTGVCTWGSVIKRRRGSCNNESDDAGGY